MSIMWQPTVASHWTLLIETSLMPSAHPGISLQIDILVADMPIVWTWIVTKAVFVRVSVGDPTRLSKKADRFKWSEWVSSTQS